MAMQMGSLLASPLGGITNGSRMFGMTAFSFRIMPQIQKRRVDQSRVKCMNDQEGVESKKPQPRASTNFTDVFAFSGPAPERINGRLAMIGFVAAVAVELANGTELLDQISNKGGIEWFLGTTVLLSTASLVPLFKGQRAESKTDGLMNSNAELWNGRLAMLGLVALAFTEYFKGGALI